MANVFFMADLHLEHKAISKYRQGVGSVEENTEKLKTNYNSIVTKRDIVFFLGDVAFSLEALMELKTWNGSKVLVLGNHCTDHVSMEDIVRSRAFTKIYSLKKYKEFWLSHAPIHPAELRNKINIHGHVHTATICDPKYVNVSVDNTGMAPVSLFDIRRVIKMRTETGFELTEGMTLQDEITKSFKIGEKVRKLTKYSDMIIP